MYPHIYTLSAEHRWTSGIGALVILPFCARKFENVNVRSTKAEASTRRMSDAKELLYKMEYERYLHHRIEGKLARRQRP